jgi:small subunit ribosomal protein S17
MADETPETNEPETTEPDAPEATEPEAAAPEAPEAEAAAPEPDAEVEAAPEAEAEEEAAPEAAAPAAPPREPDPIVSPKDRKAASRARRGPRRASTPEARQALRKEKAAARTRRRGQEREKAKALRAAAPATEPAPHKEHGPGRPKTREGRVVSAKPDKTITVKVDTARRHRRYEKIVRSSSTLHAHDETNDASEGDLVRVIESRPLSRLKRWRLVEVLERAK